MSITWDEIKDPRNKFKNNDKWYKVTNNEVEISALGSGHTFRPCVLAERYRDFVESVWQYQVNSDDVWITTHPVSLCVCEYFCMFTVCNFLVCYYSGVVRHGFSKILFLFNCSTQAQRLQNHYFREMVWLIANNLNYEEGQKVLLRTRSPTIRKL